MSRGLRLYRALLREHKNRLPPQMRKLGNDYVKNEFKLHASAKEEHLTPFFKEWDAYLETLRRRSGNFGSDMDNIENLSDEQRQKLNELRAEASKVDLDK